MYKLFTVIEMYKCNVYLIHKLAQWNYNISIKRLSVILFRYIKVIIILPDKKIQAYFAQFQ